MLPSQVTFYNDVCYFVDQPLPPPRPVIRSHVGSSVHLEWFPPDGKIYAFELLKSDYNILSNLQIFIN
jgi:hypothetical protein